MLMLAGTTLLSAVAATLNECQPRGGLPHVSASLAAGKPVKIAFLGGSITEGDGWRVLVIKSLRAQNPKWDLTGLNAAVSGTGAEYGACRLERNALSQHPDLLLVEFACNGAGENDLRRLRSFEGLIRQARLGSPEMDICVVYTLHTPQLELLQNDELHPLVQIMERVAAHYNVPSILLGLEVARDVKAGKLLFQGKPGNPGVPVFSTDGTHPDSKTGHPYYERAFVRSWPLMLKASTAPQALPAPIDPLSWSAAGELTFDQTRHDEGWRKLRGKADFPVKDISRELPQPLYLAEQSGSWLEFSFRGTAFGFEGIKGADVGQCRVTVDGTQTQTFTFFDSFSTPGRYRIRPWFWPEELADTTHTVRLELMAEPLDKVALMAGKKPAPTAKDYAGQRLYLGHILIGCAAGR